MHVMCMPLCAACECDAGGCTFQTLGSVVGDSNETLMASFCSIDLTKSRVSSVAIHAGKYQYIPHLSTLGELLLINRFDRLSD